MTVLKHVVSGCNDNFGEENVQSDISRQKHFTKTATCPK